MATKVSIINEALIHIGQPPSVGPSDTSTWVRRVSDRYPSVARRLLEIHSWNFATVSEELSQLSEASGGRGYSYNKPSKCLNILYVNTTGDPDDRDYFDWEDSDGKIHSDSDVLYMFYISSDYLIKEGSWPEVFAAAVSADLAFICSPMATKDQNLKRDLRDLSRGLLKKAKSWDASQKNFRKNTMGSWARSRNVGSRYNTEGR